MSLRSLTASTETILTACVTALCFVASLTLLAWAAMRALKRPAGLCRPSSQGTIQA